ncbi:hypothetical protein ES288_D03G054600v1 [Gossypium darwinii]|uniref:Uncharacterized protein n=1 Tax=Gossypium darwinii TaxID=34276 RepID=A0A5D2D5C4_GOSDA|nr:hypothetical protein ES288_D03G054600v1 [Gossypium darwinii]
MPQTKMIPPRFNRTCPNSKPPLSYTQLQIPHPFFFPFFNSSLQILRMNKSRTRRYTLFLLWLIILSHQIRPVVCEGNQYNEEKPSLFQLVSNTFSLLKKSHQSSWEKVKTIIHEFQLQFTPPSLDFRGTGGKDPGKASDGTGEKVKEAVKDSIETSEAIAEETAKTAAEAVHKTDEKVKESASSKPDDSHEEL